MWGCPMSDRAFYTYMALVIIACALAFYPDARAQGRCQSACWLAGYTYVSTDATACLCDGAGMPVAVAVPKAP